MVDYLKAAGYCSAEKILERDDWSTKRRREFANKVVDKMEKRGEIASLWRDFRSETTRARNVGVCYRRLFGMPMVRDELADLRLAIEMGQVVALSHMRISIGLEV